MRNGQEAKIENLTLAHLQIPVYNIIVDDYHTYAVGPGGAVVHNNSKANNPWKITNTPRYFTHGKHKYSYDPNSKLWWSKDTGHHGTDVTWKVYKEGVAGGRRGLLWYRDADIYGNFLDPNKKHKGPIGIFIPF